MPCFCEEEEEEEGSVDGLILTRFAGCVFCVFSLDEEEDEEVFLDEVRAGKLTSSFSNFSARSNTPVFDFTVEAASRLTATSM